jgi:hypothetical protein
LLGPSKGQKKKNKKQGGAAAAPQKTKNTQNANKFVARCSQGHPLKFDANEQVGTQYLILTKITCKVLFFCFKGEISHVLCVQKTSWMCDGRHQPGGCNRDPPQGRESYVPLSLNGQCHEIFDFRFFQEFSFVHDY